MAFLKQKKLTREQINEYKMTEREIYKKSGNLNEDELNAKSNKNIYIRNVVMTTIIKRCRGIRAIDRFRKKLMIPDFEIPKCPNLKSNQKQGSCL